MHRRDGYHPDHPITCRQVKLLRLAVDALPKGDLALAALFGADPNPPSREEYARLYALLIRVAGQGGTFDLERVCGCCVDNECECDGTALRPAYADQLGTRPRRRVSRSPARPMPLTAIKATVREGTVWQMTNHRHTLDGHTPEPPSLVKVVHVTASGSSFHLASAGSEDGSDVPGGPAIIQWPVIQWPVAARVGYDAAAGAIRLYGPAGDRSDPWLTLVPVRPAAAALPEDREHHPVLVLSAGTGEDGTCNCQEPGPAESDERTCRNCGYPLSETQRRELARSTEPGG